MKTNIIFSIFLVVGCRASALTSLTSLETKVTDMMERMERMEAEMEAKDERIAALEAREDSGGGVRIFTPKIPNFPPKIPKIPLRISEKIIEP